MSRPKRLVVAATGASGAIYFERTVRALLRAGHHADLIISKYGACTLREETDFGAFDGSYPEFLRNKYGPAVGTAEVTVHGHSDQTSRIASGSGIIDGMAIVPCSMKTLAAVAQGYARDLVSRAADVSLKERRRLVLVPREAPYNLIHLRNMVTVTEAGAVVLPASPAFYQRPQTLDDLADFIAQRVLSLFDITVDLVPVWEGLAKRGGSRHR